MPAYASIIDALSANDLVTARDFNLYDEMLEWIGQKPQALNGNHQSIYAHDSRFGC